MDYINLWLFDHYRTFIDYDQKNCFSGTSSSNPYPNNIQCNYFKHRVDMTECFPAQWILNFLTYRQLMAVRENSSIKQTDATLKGCFHVFIPKEFFFFKFYLQYNVCKKKLINKKVRKS